MGSWEEQQSQAEYPGCPWDPKRIFYRRHWEDSGAILQPLQPLLICKQPLSHHVFCKTHQPVRSMTESSTSSFYRVSCDRHGASASKTWVSLVGKVPPGCRARLRAVAATMLLSISCKKISGLMGSIRGYGLTTWVHVLAVPVSSLLSHQLLTSQWGKGYKIKRVHFSKSALKSAMVQQNTSIYLGGSSSSPSKQAVVTKKWFLYFKMHLSLNKLFYHEYSSLLWDTNRRNF